MNISDIINRYHQWRNRNRHELEASPGFKKHLELIKQNPDISMARIKQYLQSQDELALAELLRNFE